MFYPCFLWKNTNEGRWRGLQGADPWLQEEPSCLVMQFVPYDNGIKEDLENGVRYAGSYGEGGPSDTRGNFQGEQREVGTTMCWLPFLVPFDNESDDWWETRLLSPWEHHPDRRPLGNPIGAGAKTSNTTFFKQHLILDSCSEQQLRELGQTSLWSFFPHRSGQCQHFLSCHEEGTKTQVAFQA